MVFTARPREKTNEVQHPSLEVTSGAGRNLQGGEGPGRGRNTAADLTPPEQT